ncbi:MAG: hypothetical protein HQK66_14525, partial [Desulfamplus sp.]|nr:hypothetical protein [Desulfamplus sp.]
LPNGEEQTHRERQGEQDEETWKKYDTDHPEEENAALPGEPDTDPSGDTPDLPGKPDAHPSGDTPDLPGKPDAHPSGDTPDLPGKPDAHPSSDIPGTPDTDTYGDTDIKNEMETDLLEDPLDGIDPSFMENFGIDPSMELPSVNYDDEEDSEEEIIKTVENIGNGILNSDDGTRDNLLENEYENSDDENPDEGEYDVMEDYGDDIMEDYGDDIMKDFDDSHDAAISDFDDTHDAVIKDFDEILSLSEEDDELHSDEEIESLMKESREFWEKKTR